MDYTFEDIKKLNKNDLKSYMQNLEHNISDKEK